MVKLSGKFIYKKINQLNNLHDLNQMKFDQLLSFLHY